MLISLSNLKKVWFAKNMSIEFELYSIKHEHINEERVSLIITKRG
jgi:hypothetical protein